MHGVVYMELQKYVNSKFGISTWFSLLKSSGLEGKVYLPTRPYPDEDIIAIVTNACMATGLSADQILEDFGAFIAPDLIKIFATSIDPKWRTLEFLQNVESVIHSAVRINNPGATPPELIVKRKGDSVEILYSSQRKMVSLGIGIIKALSQHYGEEKNIEVKLRLASESSSIITVTRTSR